MKISSPTVNGRRMARIVPPMKFERISFAARPKVRPPTPDTPRIEDAGRPKHTPAFSTDTTPMAIVARRVMTVLSATSMILKRVSRNAGRYRLVVMIASAPLVSM